MTADLFFIPNSEYFRCMFKKKQEIEVHKSQAEDKKSKKNITLGTALLLDGIGLISYLIPAYGEIFDTVWAPVSAIILFAKFGRTSLPASLLQFVEELLPFADFIPTFTLTYLYTKFYKRQPQ